MAPLKSCLRRHWLKGCLGDALNAVLCGAGHNLRMILKAIRLFYAWIISLLIAGMEPSSSQNTVPQRFAAH